MTKPRIPETDHGIQGDSLVANYDQMQRHLRDKGWIETPSLIKHGIQKGRALEIGHGHGYLGLEWLKHSENTTLTGLDISPDMRNLAIHNAQSYGFSARSQYQLGNCDNLPFEDNTFDMVFTNGSLHEWVNPCSAFEEIWRVLKPGGTYYISDLRRDMNYMMCSFLWLSVRPISMRPGLMTSINAAYTQHELNDLTAKTRLKNCQVSTSPVGISILGKK